MNYAKILLPILAVSVLLAGYDAAYGLLPPAPSSATYTTGDGTLVIEFSEPVTMMDYSKIHVRSSDTIIALADVQMKTNDTDTITAKFDPQQMAVFETMPFPRLVVDHAAVLGQLETPILDGIHLITIYDTQPPEVSSAVYSAVDRQVRITFDEIITLDDSSKLHLYNSTERADGITLTSVNSIVNYQGSILFVNLNSTQNATVGAFDAPRLDIDAGAVSDRSDNLILAESGLTIDTDDTVAPSVGPVGYDTNLNLLHIAFDSPLKERNYNKMHIRDSGESTGGITLAHTIRMHHVDTVYVLFDAAEMATFHEMSAPQLDMDSGAVSDFSGNSIAALNDTLIDISDTARPAFESAHYNTTDGALSITFSENVTLGTSAVFRIHDINRDAATGISLGSSDLTASGNTVNDTLTASQTAKIGAMHAPRLDIDADSVHDSSDNNIRSAQDLKVSIDDAVPPALVHVKYFTSNSTMHLEFNMPLNNNPNYTKIRVHDSESSTSIRLDSFLLNRVSTDSITARPGDHAGQIESMAAPQLDIDAGAVSERDAASNTNRVAANLTISTPDTDRPEVDSATYVTGDGTLTVMFNEPVSLLNHAKMRIHDSGESIRGINFADAASIDATADTPTDTVIVTLTDPQRDAVGTMTTPVLRIDHSKDYETAAAYDTSANPVRSNSYPINMTDTIPPMLVSAVYDAAVLQVTITFNENVTGQNYSNMRIHDSGNTTAAITLDAVTPRAETARNTTFTFVESQKWIFGNLTAPELDIDAGAVSDGSDNPIAATTNNTIVTGDVTEPKVESAAYDTNLSMLTIKFDEPVHKATYSNLYIRDTGSNTGGITFGNLTQRHLAGDTMYVILDEESEDAFNAMSVPELDVFRDAVRDYSDNEISTTLNIEITINDTTRPSVQYVGYKPIHDTVKITSAVYHPGFGNMTLKFTEPVTEPDLADLYVRDYVNYVSLNMSNSMSKLDPITNQSITVQFDRPYQGEIHYLDTPLFGIKRDAVSDNATTPNQILPFLDRFTVVDITPPQLAIAIVSPDRSEVTLYFTEDVVDVHAAPSDFVVQHAGVDAVATVISVSEDSATLRLSRSLPNATDTTFPYIIYNQTSGHIQDLSGNNFGEVIGIGLEFIDDPDEYENYEPPSTISTFTVPVQTSNPPSTEAPDNPPNNPGGGSNNNLVINPPNNPGSNSGNPDLSGIGPNNRYNSNADPPIMDLNSLRSSQFNIDIPYELLSIVHDHDWRTPTSPIVVNGTFDYPVEINGLGYPLGGMSSTLESQEVVAGQPASIDFVLYDYRTIAHFTLYMNLHDLDIQYSNSDTYIRFDNGTLQVTDPNNMLSNVTVTQETDEIYSFKTNVNFLVTFNETMGSTNMVVRTWNSMAYSMLAHMIDAITVIPAANATTTTTNSTLSVVPEPDPGTSEAAKLQTIRMWAGFDPETATDTELLEALGLSQDGEIPSWVKPNLGRMVALGHITVDEFVMAVSYLIGE